MAKSQQKEQNGRALEQFLAPLSVGAVLVTNNEREFGRVSNLLVENWVM